MDLDQRCPHCGDISTTPDVCSECGLSMKAATPSVSASPAVAAVPAASVVEMACPVCGEHRSSLQDRFCGTCRYDYVLKKPFGAAPEPAPVEPAPSPAPAVQVPSIPIEVHAASPLDVGKPPLRDTGMPRELVRWELVAVADPSLCEPGADQPGDTRERIYPIDFAENMIGRKPGGSGMHPEIALPDPGVSRRHARIDRRPDGCLSVMDLGSTNGTKVNETPLEPNVPLDLVDGDVVLVGSYTRMTVRGR